MKIESVNRSKKVLGTSSFRVKFKHQKTIIEVATRHFQTPMSKGSKNNRQFIFLRGGLLNMKQVLETK